MKQENFRSKNSSPLQKVRVFFSGLLFAIQMDRSVVIQIVISSLALVVCFWFREWVDFLLILIVTGFMLVSEIFNTVIETICDYLQPGHDLRIGQIKDIAASATGISVIIWVVTLVYEIIRVLNC